MRLKFVCQHVVFDHYFTRNGILFDFLQQYSFILGKSSVNITLSMTKSENDNNFGALNIQLCDKEII